MPLIYPPVKAIATFPAWPSKVAPKLGTYRVVITKIIKNKGERVKAELKFEGFIDTREEEE